MTAEKESNAHLWDMVTAVSVIERFVQNRDMDDYLVDVMLRSAVEWQIEIIGEAAGHVSKEFGAALRTFPGGRFRRCATF